jgi:hypothetical protein
MRFRLGGVGMLAISLLLLLGPARAADQPSSDVRAEAAANRAEAAAARAEAAADRTEKAVERLERVMNEMMRREEARRRR